MSIELVMPSNHLILSCPLLLLLSIFPSIRISSNESALHIRWPKYWSFSFQIKCMYHLICMISISPSLIGIWGFPRGSVVKNLLAIQETWVQSMGWEDLLEKEMATYSSILAWEIAWKEESGGLQFMGSQESDMTEWLKNNKSEHRTDWNTVKVITRVTKLPPGMKGFPRTWDSQCWNQEILK